MLLSEHDPSYFEFAYLGRCSFRDGLKAQLEARRLVEQGEIGGALLLLEHDLTVTMGRRTSPQDLLASAEWFADQGVALHEVDRGGKATLHAPGQLVGYPVMPVSHVADFVRDTEGVLIDLLAMLGITAGSRSLEGPDFTGVWVEDRKIASIGFHLRRSITTHGFALNVDMDMQAWQWIVPCGISCPMTSVQEEVGEAPSLPDLACALSGIWADRFSLEFRDVSPLREFV